MLRRLSTRFYRRAAAAALVSVGAGGLWVMCAPVATVSAATPVVPESAGVRTQPLHKPMKVGRGIQTTTGDIRHDMEALVYRIQDEICNELAAIDGTPFKEDRWEREAGGGGRSRVLQNGNVFEKAGVNVSVIHGVLNDAAIKDMRSRGKLGELSGEGPFPFYVAGISLVIHPSNPFAPTSHANYRYFEVTGRDPATGEPRRVWWFGGGADLTPSYLFEEDAKYFHGTLKAACDKHHPSYYPIFKEWCDHYFTNKHRKEMRGIGGIFYDDLHDGILPTAAIEGFSSTVAASTDPSLRKCGIADCAPAKPAAAGAAGAKPVCSTTGSANCAQPCCGPYAIFPFVVDAAEAYVPAYAPLVRKRKDTPFTEANKRWQQLRRGRYVEFNLVYDRGTKFGFNTPGSRVESILMSLPLTARWEYQAVPTPGSDEAKLLDACTNPKQWV